MQVLLVIKVGEVGAFEDSDVELLDDRAVEKGVPTLHHLVHHAIDASKVNFPP